VEETGRWRNKKTRYGAGLVAGYQIKTWLRSEGQKLKMDCLSLLKMSVYSGCHKYVPWAILDVIDNPQKTQQTTAIGTLF